MAATLTTIINGVTVGATASPMSNLSKLTLQAGSTYFSLSASLTLGRNILSTGLNVHFCVSPDTLTPTAAEIFSVLRNKETIIFPTGLASGQTYRFTTPTKLITGGFVYVWIEEPVLSVTGTLTVKGFEF